MSLTSNQSQQKASDIFMVDLPLDKSKAYPVRLKIINQFFPPDYAATGQLIEELAHQLQGSVSSVEVFTSQPGYAFDAKNPPHAPRREQFEFLSIHRSHSAQLWQNRIRGKTLTGVLFFLRATVHLLRSSRRRELVLLTTAPPFLPFLGYVVSRFCKISYVCLLYDLYPDIAIELDVIENKSWISKFWDKCNALTWQQAQAIIVLSDTMKDRIVAKQPGIAHKISVIPNWTEPKVIKPIDKSQNWFAKEHGLVEPFTVLYSGNMGRCHDMDTLLDAIMQLKDKPIKFVFIGSGDQRDFVQNKVQQAGVNNCLFLPYQSRENLPFSLTACDVSIVSIAEAMEGLIAPSKLYSALAAGTPVAAICPAHSYLNDVIIAQACCGETFRNGDGEGLAAYLEKLSNNNELVKNLGRSGREYCVNNYSKEKIAQDYLQLFCSLPSKKVN
jgi:glycosyltransferase involved in cell wall biosynthesis